MNSRHLVDPELLPLLDMLPTVTITRENLAARRARTLAMPIDRDARVAFDLLSIPGPAGPLPLYLYRAADMAGPLPTIYHIHGGGYVAGSASQLEAIHRALVAELGCALVSVDYRLAPEAVFPAAIEDCHAGLAWTFAHAEDWGLDRTRIGLLGESAGGGIAAGLALMVRDRGEYRLRFQHLIAPMLDDRTCLTEPHPVAGEHLWHRPNNLFAWRAMLGQEPGGLGISQYAAPARAVDLTGLPPTFLSVGALDLFVEEDLEYARRLMRAGVPVELHVWPGAIHGFELVPDAAVAQTARRTATRALAKALRGVA